MKLLDGYLDQKKALLSELRELSFYYRGEPPGIWLSLIGDRVELTDNDSFLGILGLREKIREDHEAYVEKLKKIQSDIYISSVDDVLEKINKILETIDN